MFNELELRLLSYILDNYRKEVFDRCLLFQKINVNDVNAKHYRSILKDIDYLKEKINVKDEDK